MRSLARLIWNEYLKMIYRTSTLVMCGGLMALILFSFALDRWYNPFYTGYWQAVASQSWLSFFIMVMAVILAGRIIADEFQWGTIKFLLIRPAGRSRILFVKYGAVLCFCFFLLMVLFLCSMILNWIFQPQGVADPSLPSKEENGNGSAVGMVLKLYALRMVEIAVYAGISFMISALFKSVALATGLTFFFMLFGPETANQLGTSGFGSYFLFHHTGLSQYAQWNVTESVFSLAESLGVVLIHLAIFYGIAWIRFTKQDVF